MATMTTNWIGAYLANKRYQVSEKLGEGGMGVVYRARDLHLNTDVVVKVPHLTMLADPDFAGRFDREVRSLVQLVHPHIVKVSDVGKFNEIPFAVMQYLSGGSLRDRARADASGNGQPCPLSDLDDWLNDVASALDHIHSQKYIHRDVKPDNILFDAHGNVYLSDFGIAKVVADAEKRAPRTVMTNVGIVLGTAPYMAPEVLLGQAFDGRADQYALAVTVYQMLAGRLPFDGATPAAILMQISKPARPLHERVSSVPKALSTVLQSGMQSDPAKRFSSCTAFAERVLAAAQEKPMVGHAVKTRASPAVPRRTEPARCPLCDRSFNLDSALRGKRVRCPNCQGIFIPKKLDAAAKVETGNVSGGQTIPIQSIAKPPLFASVGDWVNKYRTGLIYGGIPAALALILLIAIIGWRATSPAGNMGNQPLNPDHGDQQADKGNQQAKKGKVDPEKDKKVADLKKKAEREAELIAAHLPHANPKVLFGINKNQVWLKCRPEMEAAAGVQLMAIPTSTVLRFERGPVTYTLPENIQSVKLEGDSRWESQESSMTKQTFTSDVNEDFRVSIEQICDVIPSKQPVPGVGQRAFDTLLVRYRAKNTGKIPIAFGVRTMLDTMIGDRDAVSLAVPGEPFIVDTCEELFRIPDFLQGMERLDLQQPGTVARFTFNLKGIEAPSRILITKWAFRVVNGFRVPAIAWEIEKVPMKDDSAVVMYWGDKVLEPGQSREVGYCYGLGYVAGEEGKGKLGVSIAGTAFTPASEFDVLAYVKSPLQGQKLKLELPSDGLDLVDKKSVEQEVPLPRDAGGIGIVTWRVRALAAGRFQVRVHMPGRNLSQGHPVWIFNGKTEKK
ncbi:MAG TPA: protein kinase [Gemmataceae bacterium]|nr:protein kinase [Gemmataceae bacterium]